MTFPNLTNDRFTTETGLRITVQVPETHAEKIMQAVRAQTPLIYGDYDSVSFRTTPGVQQFRSLGSGRNAATTDVVEVPCVELSFFLHGTEAETINTLKAIYAAHPYEEPVVFAQPTLRACHIRGLDEDNPNRFWNSAPEDWVPEAHR